MATLPIVEFAAVMRMNEAKVRDATRTAVAGALRNKGSVENIRRVMEVALQQARR
jgi:hypothetical protein